MVFSTQLKRFYCNVIFVAGNVLCSCGMLTPDLKVLPLFIWFTIIDERQPFLETFPSITKFSSFYWS